MKDQKTTIQFPPHKGLQEHGDTRALSPLEVENLHLHRAVVAWKECATGLWSGMHDLSCSPKVPLAVQKHAKKYVDRFRLPE